MRSLRARLLITVTFSLNSSIALPSMLSDFPSNPLLVGSTWTLSSSIFTTYFTTAFLKHEAHKQNVKQQLESNDFEAQNYDARALLENERNNLIMEPRLLGLQLIRQITRPQLLTLYRFTGSFLIGIFVHPQIFGWIERLRNTVGSMADFAPPAVLLFTANYCNSISLDRIGISLTYTSKCSIPLITVIITLMMHGFEMLPPTGALLSLIPIAVGVAMASWNPSSFDRIGFLAAMGSSTSQAALNVVSKQAIVKSGISGMEAQRAMAAMASIISILVTGLYCYSVGRKITVLTTRKQLSSSSKRISPPYMLSLAAVMAYHVEYVLSFMFVKLVQPVTYGACDAVRRLLIIVSGRKMFGGEAFSPLNQIGIGLALIGALGFSLTS